MAFGLGVMDLRYKAPQRNRSLAADCQPRQDVQAEYELRFFDPSTLNP